MNNLIFIRPQAENDIGEAYVWYETQRAGLGDEFLLRVEASLDEIRHEPLLNTYIYKEIRRKLIRRFP